MQICVEIIQPVREIEGVAGVHVRNGRGNYPPRRSLPALVPQRAARAKESYVCLDRVTRRSHYCKESRFTVCSSSAAWQV